MPLLTLFGLERSVYTRIARLALEEKGVAYSLQEVEIFGPAGVPSDHLKLHPFGRIPALQHAAFTLYETAAIGRYVDEGFPGPALQPSAPVERARMNQVIGVLDAYAYRPMVSGIFVERVRVPLNGGTANEVKISGALAEAETCLAALERLVRPGPFLVAEHITLADLHAFPILCYLSLAPEGRTLLERHKHLLNWYEPMLLRPSVIRTRSRYEVAK